MRKINLIIFFLFFVFCFLNCADPEPVNINDLVISPNAPQTLLPFEDLTAKETVTAMTIGWNLGHSLEALGGETSLGNPRVTQQLIDAVKDAGFNTIRIPVSWSQSADRKTNIIRAAFMDRVTEIVNYAVNNDMYVIINTHNEENLFKFEKRTKEKSLVIFENIWKQIAHNFQNYDEKLIFEALNEPLTPGSQAERTGGTEEEHEAINEHYQVFIDVVRASGGNNGKRVVILNPYAASWRETAVNGLELPKDTVPHKIIVSIHAYEPSNFCITQPGVSLWNGTGHEGNARSAFTPSISKFVRNGIPLIIGETGALDKNNNSERVQWAQYFLNYGKTTNNTNRPIAIPCILWDNGVISGTGDKFGIFDRSSATVTPRAQDYLYALMLGAGVIEEESSEQ